VDDVGVHLRHCNQGEYIGACKYGDDSNCPALIVNEPRKLTPFKELCELYYRRKKEEGE